MYYTRAPSVTSLCSTMELPLSVTVSISYRGFVSGAMARWNDVFYFGQIQVEVRQSSTSLKQLEASTWLYSRVYKLWLSLSGEILRLRER